METLIWARFSRLVPVGLAMAVLSSCGFPADDVPVRPPIAVDMPVAAGPDESESPPPSGSAPVPEPTPVPTPQPRERHAVLIGIDSAPGSPTLRGAVADARTTRDALHRYGWTPESITVLEGRAAGRDGILNAIGRLRAIPAGGQTVFLFAGHTRKVGGQNQLVAGAGRLISARMLADALRPIEASMWASFPTCYAAGFAVPGIVGPGRVVTFASAAGERSYEATSFGKSFLVEYMVHREMLGGFPAGSVEAAFTNAAIALTQAHPQWVPLIDDRYAGEFVLGTPGPLTVVGAVGPPQDAPPPPPARKASAGAGKRQPPPTPTPRPNDEVAACGAGVSVGSCDP